MGNSASHANGGAGTPSGGSGQPHHGSNGHGHGHHNQSHSQPPPAARRPSPNRRPSSSVDRGPGGTVGAAGGGGNTGRPLKNKKKSLELPDLNLNSLSTISPAVVAPQRVPSQLPSAPIPIPIPGGGGAAAGGSAGRGRSGGSRERDGRRDTKDGKNTANNANNNNTTANTNNNTAAAAATANAGRMISEDALAAGPSTLVVPPPPPLAPTKISSNASFGRKEKKVPKRAKTGYPERVVKSMLYSGVPTNHDGIVNVLAPSSSQKCQVQLLYPGQAENVSVSGTYEPSWDVRTDLQYDEDKRMWFTQVEVAPAAYHIKFLVDGVWKTSDALPLATDSGGRLVNYIDVRTKGPEIKEWGRDWWGVGTEEEEEQEQGAWTNVPPSYLEQAARLEEQEEAYRRQSPGNHPRRRVLPMPPQLPRHLDKVILNTRAGTGSSGREARSSINGQASPGEAPRGRTSHPTHQSHSPGARPSPMTGLSPAPANSENVTTPTGGPGSGSGDGKKGRRDSGGSGGGGGGGGGGNGTRSRRGSSSVDIGLYGGALVAEGAGMTGTTVAIGSPIGDDNSVLPLPSHSVVNHLATSAIRNGILAVATTTRYKAKYISTVYYRPTHPEESPDESEGAETDEPISPPPSGLPSASVSVSGIAATLANGHPTANGAVH